jgi:glutamine synthetase
VYKLGVREIARQHGLEASFMAKWHEDYAGSSCHLHVSLWEGDRNVFVGRDGGISEICQGFIGGLLEHAAALTAFASPTVNSYKRTAAGGLAPTTARLGGDDREAYVRLPGDGEGATRVELRAGDAAANPYLLTAASLYAGLDGIDRALPADKVAPLPRTLDDAVGALEADEAIRSGLGEELVRVYAALKRGEFDRFANAVTDWEWKEYVYQA